MGKPTTAAERALPDRTHEYTDEQGKNLFRVCRIGTGKKKDVWQEPWGTRPAAESQFGGWGAYEDWLSGAKMDGIRLVLYRLPTVRMAAELGMHVYISEGEKGVERVEQEGEVATTNPGGAGKWKDSYSESLKGVCAITVCVDKDEEGWEHARQVVASLRWVLPAVVRIETVEAKEGHDVYDHLEAGHSLDELVPVHLGEDAPPPSGGYDKLSKEERLDRRDWVKEGAFPPQQEVPPILFMKEIESKDISWLWYGYLPFGKIIILEGDPDVGKSLITSDLAATVSVGGRLPDGGVAPETAVLLLSAEDDAEDTGKPRLEAAGARMDRVGVLPVQRDKEGSPIPLMLPDDIPRLRSAIDYLKAATGLPRVMVIVDPVMAYLSERVQTHVDASSRRATTPMKELAAETGALFLLLRHLRKDKTGGAKSAGGGSVAFGAASRGVLVCGHHPGGLDMMVMARVKNNLAAKGSTPTLGYTWEMHPTINQPRVKWLGIQAVDADGVVSGPDSRKNASRRQEAINILSKLLDSQGGRIKAGDGMNACREAGISRAVVYEAKRQMGLLGEQILKDGGTFDHWEWYRPTEGTIIHLPIRA